MASIAVTGANGFVGRHLVRELVSAGHTVVGIGRDESALEPDLLADYIGTNLTADWPSTPAIDAVAHLAGLAAVGPSFDNPGLYVNENSAMVINLFEALRAAQKSPRVLIVSSGAVYDSDTHPPLTEQSPLGYSSPYVVSKVLVENLGSYYRRLGADVVIARPFNHIGPGQGLGFIVPDLVLKTQQLRAGRHPNFGNLSTVRDYTDVRDVARAYRLLLEADPLPDEIYNVCSGRSVEGTQILAWIQSSLGDQTSLSVAQRAIRPHDPSTITGSHQRLTELTGWQPEIHPQESIGDYINSLPK
jgi:GDP-4-dehydro-6-deoxy-D-mannose reductase